jgi:hypothetical protein
MSGGTPVNKPMSGPPPGKTGLGVTSPTGDQGDPITIVFPYPADDGSFTSNSVTSNITNIALAAFVKSVWEQCFASQYGISFPGP